MNAIANMHTVLLFVKVVRTEQAQEWGYFLTMADAVSREYGDISRLAENVWIVSFAKNPSALAALISAADRNRVPYMLLPFAEAPQWLPVGSDPTSILGHNGRS